MIQFFYAVMPSFLILIYGFKLLEMYDFNSIKNKIIFRKIDYFAKIAGRGDIFWNWN